MNTKPRVLIIENSIDVTGALKSIFAMATDLSDRYDFVFLLPKNSRAKTWITSRSKFDVIELPMLEISKSWKTLLYIPMLAINSVRLAAFAVKHKIDIVHSNDLYNLVGIYASFYTRRKYVCHARFLPDKFHPAIYGLWTGMQSGRGPLIAVSHFLRNKFSFDKDIRVIHDRILPTNNHLNVQRTNNTILCLSNIIRGKGHEQVIEAFAKVSANYPGWKLRFVGSTMGLSKNEMYKAELKRRSEVLKIADRIEWNDFSDDVELEYKSADIFVNFSGSESFSMTCLESLYYGCPAIATKSGGPAEIIDDGVSGILVGKGDIESMAASMTRLVSDAGLRRSMGEQGAKLVREKFSAAHTSELLHQVYTGILR